jgi:hypothetical protein
MTAKTTASLEKGERTQETSSRINRGKSQPAPSVSQSAFDLPGFQNTAGNLAIQHVAKTSTAGGDNGLSRRIRAASAGGSGLDREARSRLEHGLGADLSDVRVHIDGEADQLARSVNAVAFTTGKDIFFRAGTYNPGSERGMRLLAHEAAHVVQQATGPVAATPAFGGVSVSAPGDSFEQAAGRSADNVMAGTPAVSVRRRWGEVGHTSAQDIGPGAGEPAPLKSVGTSGSATVLQRTNGSDAPTPPPEPFGPGGEQPQIPGPPKVPEFPDYPIPPPYVPGGVDLAGLAVTAAAVVLPIVAAGVIAAGLFQGAKLTQAEIAAANAGVAARQKAKTVTAGYAHVITGGANKGDEGSAEAERQIVSMMAKTNASRDQVVEAVKTQQGGYYAIYEKNLKRIKDRLYTEAVRVFEETYQGEFGFIEELGETWGMRGVFRRTLRLVLYGDD